MDLFIRQPNHSFIQSFIDTSTEQVHFQSKVYAEVDREHFVRRLKETNES